ncbi:MAG: hypothetical protein B6D41_00020 [Chloroflexi bacterium UTCFX4]|nr:MAG: hypothetical protein B6D41_00020 [Chloroflexi bacterium UTCFX4]
MFVSFIKSIHSLTSRVSYLTNYRNSSVPYIGLATNGNLGDEYLYHLACRYLRRNLEYRFPSRNISFKIAFWNANQQYVFGGGSLLFDNGELRKLERLYLMGMHLTLWGTGSRDLPEDNDQRRRWASILRSAIITGVRGHITAQSLRVIGIESEIVGDMGFLINLEAQKVCNPTDVVLINPRLIPERNKIIHVQDLSRLAALADIITKLYAQGLEIIIYIADKQDSKSLGYWLNTLAVPVRVFAYDGKIDTFLNLISTARAMISMKMHPGLFAIALGVPTLFLESRSKYYDALSCLPESGQVADITEYSSHELGRISLGWANEHFSVRSTRFAQARKLAIQQQTFCKKVESSLKNKIK